MQDLCSRNSLNEDGQQRGAQLGGAWRRGGMDLDDEMRGKLQRELKVVPSFQPAKHPDAFIENNSTSNPISIKNRARRETPIKSFARDDAISPTMSAPMTSRLISRSARLASLPLRSHQTSIFRPSTYRLVNINNGTLVSSSKCFSISTSRRTGIMPDTDNPSTPPREPDTQPAPMDMTDDEYHERADVFMDQLHDKAEEIQEGREDVEVEHAAGVLTITFPPNGTYVLNKQPPNKQIWLASPITGPKRFDWVMQGDSMNQKEGGGVGDWVYLRDGTTLSGLLRKEIGISVDVTGHEESMQEKSLDPTE